MRLFRPARLQAVGETGQPQAVGAAASLTAEATLNYANSNRESCNISARLQISFRSRKVRLSAVMEPLFIPGVRDRI